MSSSKNRRYVVVFIGLPSQSTTIPANFTPPLSLSLVGVLNEKQRGWAPSSAVEGRSFGPLLASGVGCVASRRLGTGVEAGREPGRKGGGLSMGGGGGRSCTVSMFIGGEPEARVEG